jgi:hypothetical protein
VLGSKKKIKVQYVSIQDGSVRRPRSYTTFAKITWTVDEPHIQWQKYL